MFKSISKVVLSLVVAALLVLAFILVSAHRQVRAVTPDLPTESDLLAIKSRDGPVNVSYLLTSSQALGHGQIAHISIIVEWADGKLFVIDTGMSQGEARAFGAFLKKLDSSAGHVNAVGTIATLLQDDIHRVAGVGFTHLHIDHTEGVREFCSVRRSGAVVLQSVTQATLHNFNTKEGAELIARSCLKRQEFNGDTLSQFDDFPGIAAYSLGGHTPGSTLWAVALNNKMLLFSGDTTNDKHSIYHDKAKPSLYSYLLVPENTNRTATLRKWLLSFDKKENFSVIVSHDLENTKEYLPRFTVH